LNSIYYIRLVEPKHITTMTAFLSATTFLLPQSHALSMT
jgi:hypothetical protein